MFSLLGGGEKEEKGLVSEAWRWKDKENRSFSFY